MSPYLISSKAMQMLSLLGHSFHLSRGCNNVNCDLGSFSVLDGCLKTPPQSSRHCGCYGQPQWCGGWAGRRGSCPGQYLDPGNQNEPTEFSVKRAEPPRSDCHETTRHHQPGGLFPPSCSRYTNPARTWNSHKILYLAATNVIWPTP